MSRRAASTLLALVLAAIVFDLAVLAWGESPAGIARQLLAGTWGTAYGAGQVLFKATSILLAALAAQIALRAGLFNIGVEGSITIAAFTVGAIGATRWAGVTWWIAWPMLALVGALAGALWALPAGFLRARFGAHEVISGIMLNKIAAALVSYLLAAGFAEKASVHTRPLPQAARLLRLEHLRLPFTRLDLHALHGSAANLALFAGLALAVAFPFLARRTRLGRELLAVSASQTASAAAGIPVGRRMIQAMCLSGAVAGLVSLNDVMGYKGYAEEGLSGGVGFTGLAAALLAGGAATTPGDRRRPALAMVLAALLFATLSQGGLSINARVPMEIVDAIVAVVILLVSVSPRLLAWLDAWAGRGRAA